MPGLSKRALMLGLLAAAGTAAPAIAGGTTERVSVRSGGAQADNGGIGAAMSAKGRFVAFQSGATNLVAGDTNDIDDVFVRDLETGTTRRVSIGPGGAQGNGNSFQPSVSAGGRFVAFASEASNLVPGDTDETFDVFVRDRVANTTTRVSLGPRGAEPDNHSSAPAISADGRFIAFQSEATNLVPDDTNGNSDIFVRDRKLGITERVSVGSGGGESDGHSDRPAISASGRFVAFQSLATNLVPGDSNEEADIFVHDRATGETVRVNVGPGGAQANSSSSSVAISGDGRRVAFTSSASNLVRGDTNGVGDVFVRDLEKGRTLRVSVGPSGAQAKGGSVNFLAISADGRVVAFASEASNLVGGDTNGVTDVFVRDLEAGTTIRVSVSSRGAQGNGPSGVPSLSADGRLVAFDSLAVNLVPGDTNRAHDVFLRRR